MVRDMRCLVTLPLGNPATEQDLILDRENPIAPTTHEEMGDGRTQEAVLITPAQCPLVIILKPKSVHFHQAQKLTLCWTTSA